MVDLGIKRRVLKMKSRIFASKWTKLFILTSTIQAIVIIALEVRVFFRNSDAGDRVVEFMTNNTGLPPEVCTLLPSVMRINNIQEENVIFMVFQLFQMWLCYTALYNQNTIQVITITTINFLCSLFGISQILGVQKWYEDLKVACPGRFEFKSKNQDYDLPLLGSQLVFASFMAYLCFKLYQEFGWNIYKRIGADVQIQAIYKTYLIYLMLLKLDLFFLLGSAIETCIVYGFNISNSSVGYRNITNYRYLPSSLLWIHIGVTILIFFNQLLAYHSVRKELKSGMVIVNIGWSITVLDLLIILNYSIGTVSNSWYIFIAFVSCGIIMALVTLIWSIMIIRNFGKGLQAYVDQEKGRGASKEYQRWSIDDE